MAPTAPTGWASASGRYVVRELNDLGADAAMIDAKAIDLPMLNRLYKEYPVGEAPPALEDLAERIRKADAFFFVTGEQLGRPAGAKKPDRSFS